MYTPPKNSHPSKTLVLLGEAPGAEEEKAGVPFIGSSGRLLREGLLRDAGLDADDFHILNTFSQRPDNNDLKNWTVNKTEAKKLGLDWQTLGPPLHKRYLLPQYQPLLRETRRTLDAIQPDLIVGLGATALWFLSNESTITNFRGTFFNTPWGTEAICTFHPASILYQWSNYPIAWADLRKVRQKLNADLPAPLRREFVINPTFAEMANAYARLNQTTSEIGVDIETAPSIAQITTISFSVPTFGICIPIWDKYTGRSVYSSVADEIKAWRWIDRFARLPQKKVLQNGIYDAQYLLDAPIPITLRNYTDDTALLHHALQPELPKDLGTLASLYLNEPAWKQMRRSAKDAKADE